jgi:hypothetical protein
MRALKAMVGGRRTKRERRRRRLPSCGWCQHRTAKVREGVCGSWSGAGQVVWVGARGSCTTGLEPLHDRALEALLGAIDWPTPPPAPPARHTLDVAAAAVAAAAATAVVAAGVAVEGLFQALCDASALNPDSDMEEEAGAQLFFDEAEVRCVSRAC